MDKMNVAKPVSTTTLMLEGTMYEWACGNLTNDEFKAALFFLGYTVDLRQADKDNTLEVVCRRTGEVKVISC